MRRQAIRGGMVVVQRRGSHWRGGRGGGGRDRINCMSCLEAQVMELVEITGTNGLTGTPEAPRTPGDTHCCSSVRHSLVAAKHRAACVQTPQKPPPAPKERRGASARLPWALAKPKGGGRQGQSSQQWHWRWPPESGWPQARRLSQAGSRGDGARGS